MINHLESRPLVRLRSRKPKQHFAFWNREISLRRGSLRARKETFVDDRIKYWLAANPKMLWVIHEFLPEPSRGAVIDDVSDIVFRFSGCGGSWCHSTAACGG